MRNAFLRFKYSISYQRQRTIPISLYTINRNVQPLQLRNLYLSPGQSTLIFRASRISHQLSTSTLRYKPLQNFHRSPGSPPLQEFTSQSSPISYSYLKTPTTRGPISIYTPTSALSLPPLSLPSAYPKTQTTAISILPLGTSLL